MQAEVLRIGSHGLRKTVDGRLIALLIQRFQPLFRQVGLECKQQNERNRGRHRAPSIFAQTQSLGAVA